MVDRTDGAESFVARLRMSGHAARVLDIRADDFGGGVLVASFKEGAGEGWSSKMLSGRRHFTYWSERDLHDAAVAAGWEPTEADEKPSAPTLPAGG